MWLSQTGIKFFTEHFEINYGTAKQRIAYADVEEAKIISKLKFSSCLMMILPVFLPLIIWLDPQLESDRGIFWIILVLALTFFLIAFFKREKIHYLNIEIKDCKDVRFFIEPEQLKAATNILSRLENKLKFCV